jgi:hypothetical protein
VPGTHEKYWWRCRSGHKWLASADNRTRYNKGCPYCARRRAAPETSLARVAPHLARQWHPTKNGSLRPKHVLPGSEKKVWWKCRRGPDHEWQVSCNARTNHGGTGCPFCAGQRVSVTNSLGTRFPRIAGQWHPTKNGALTPADVTPGTNRKVWWQCVTGHSWQATCANRTTQGRGCPYCSVRRRRVATRRRTREHVRLPSYEGPRVRTIRG